ncbi:MAG: recombinase RecB, partial [Desulfurococcaceae archaeon]
LGVDVSVFAKRIEELKKQNIVPRWASKYNTVKRVAQILLHRQSITSALEESRKLVEVVRALEDQFKALQGTLHSLNQQIQKLTALITKLEAKTQQGNARSTVE